MERIFSRTIGYLILSLLFYLIYTTFSTKITKFYERILLHIVGLSYIIIGILSLFMIYLIDTSQFFFAYIFLGFSSLAIVFMGVIIIVISYGKFWRF